MESAEKDYLQVKLDQERNFLYSKWNRSVSSEEYRAGVRQLMQLLRQDVYYWITDSERLRSLVMPEQQWLLREICPVLANSQLKKMARIGNGDIFNQVVIESLAEQAMEAYNYELLFKQFKTLEEALLWLQFYENRHSA